MPIDYSSFTMAVVYLLGFLLILGFSQGDPIPRNSVPAFVEDLRSASGSRIVAGWPASPGQIPHQISLRMVNLVGSVSSCGGSLIHHQWVITAGHCVANRGSFVIRLGAANITRPDYIVDATRRFLHPLYIETSGAVQTNDIALIALEHSIPYGPTIQPVRLQNSADKNRDYSGDVLTVSGYGMTDDAIYGGTVSETLNWVYLRGISTDLCRLWYPGSTVQEQTICAEYYNATAQSSCQGDSGGPLTELDEDGHPTMVGIVSFGSSAGCNSIYPSAYVRPGHYHDWFTEVTGIDFDWDRSDPEDPKPDCNGDKVIVVDTNEYSLKDTVVVVDGYKL